MKRFNLTKLLLTTLFFCLLISTQVMAGDTAIPTGKGNYQDLVQLLDEFLAFKDPAGDQPRQIIRDTAGLAIDPVADFSAAAMATQKAQMAEFQSRINDMNVAAWERHQQVDYLAVRSRLDQYDFILQHTRPWARDPGFYVDRL